MFPILLIILISLIIFKGAFSIYFFQDDFFLLSLGHINSLKGIANYFIPRLDVHFYRPISHELFYFIARNIFDFKPLGYHMVTYFFFCLNIILIYKLGKKFLGSKFYSYVLSFFYATSAIHYKTLYWISNFSYVFVTFLFLVWFLIYLSEIYPAKKNLVLSIIFLVGLLSNELMITLPIIMVCHICLFQKNNIRRNLTILVSIFVIIVIYLILRFIFFRPNFGNYQYKFDKTFISSYRWFFLFSLNWAETMTDQMLKFYKIRPGFIRAFPLEVNAFIYNFFSFIFLLTIVPMVIFARKRWRQLFNKTNIKLFSFSAIWFVVTLLPIAFIPNHISPNHASIALFGFLLLFISFYKEAMHSKPKLLSASLLSIVSVIWIFSTLMSVSLNDKVHWIIKRSDLAKEWIYKSHKTYPKIAKNSILVLNTDDYEVKIALNNGLGIKESYNDETMKVIFSTQSGTFKGEKFIP